MVNMRFVVRGLIVALTALLVFLVGLTTLLPYLFPGPPSGTPPPPPSIDVPRGELPLTHVGMHEYARYRGEDYRPVGSGFVFVTAGGVIVAATAAHTVTLDDPVRPLERVALGFEGEEAFVVELESVRGERGRARVFGSNFSIDYILFLVDVPIDPALVLTPDPRGRPQPGERVVLHSGLAEQAGGSGEWEGSVLASDKHSTWVVMDEVFDPSGMSGSPVLSLYTGKVVGMAVASAGREGHLMIGLNPIGRLVEIARRGIDTPLFEDGF